MNWHIKNLYRKVSLIVMAVGFLWGSNGLASEGLKPLNPPEKVTVAYVPIMKFATMYVAHSRKLFEKYGLDVTLRRVKSGTEAIAFLSEGKIDVGGIAIVTSLWNGWSRGLDLRIIAPGGLEPMENSPTALIARADLMANRSIKSVQDLKGMRIGVAGGPGSGGEYLLTKALQQGGMMLNDIQKVKIGNADMPKALANQSIDAALTGPPYTTQSINDGHAKVLASDLAPGLMTVAFVGSGKFVNQRADVAERFVLALGEAARLMQGDDFLDDENIKAYMTNTNTTEKALRTGKKLIYDPNIVIPVAGLKDIESVHRLNGRTEYTTELDLNNAVDERFTKKALGILGNY